MPDRKKTDHKSASPARVVIAKAERRLAEADKQRARIKADPEGEVARERLRVKRAKKEKPDT
jgi:multidrug resistance efflux pump